MIDTRLTRRFGLNHPIVSAPMQRIAGGAFASAVSRAGGLGLIGVGDPIWYKEQFSQTGRERVGCGIASSALSEQGLLQLLTHRPRVIVNTEGDPRRFADAIRQASVPLICQAKSVEDARYAVEAGAEVVIAQNEASEDSLFTLVPALADYLHHADHDIILLASGGITDARGLAAALVLGADGVVLGHRLSVETKTLSKTNHTQADADRSTPWSAESAGNILQALSDRAERILIHARRRVVR